MSVMVITGGTAGGKATALRFARAGYHVALIARDETGLQETRQACERFGIKTLAISADVVDAGRCSAAAEVETTLGAIDVWINNAMTTVLAPFRQMSEEEFRRVTE
ncbi:SDR family NAD(P)-dependent oxidoreductase [Klebsiella pneumoniae]|uniref:SDR family NAD(P)-dependent oxidoreductase n=1 Tax=Klebsiella pneumoniae TaxID=573 RepID=UPI000F290294|nr:SDR family NAD(P)-dependent oxidoreductase [Klebsiella pneumoniae]VCW51805.1 Enoyl-[acyl-carrier-protein] reductase [NADPH] FabL [Klebsiella pneumoniae]